MQGSPNKRNELDVLTFEKTNIDGLLLIIPRLLKDERGAFSRVFCQREFAEALGQELNFVQINHSYNSKKGTFRGMHYQAPPYGEGKLVRCIKGSIQDFVIDLRKGSRTFLQHFQTKISADNYQMLYIPKGLAHGFITLENDTELIYHHTEFYEPAYNTGVNVQDPMFEIPLPLPIAVISDKDQNYPFLNQDFKGIEL